MSWGSFGLNWVQLVAPRSHRVHSGSRGFSRARGRPVPPCSRRFTRAHLRVGRFSRARFGVVGFIHVRVGSLGRALL